MSKCSDPMTDAVTQAREAREMLYEAALAYYWPHDTSAGDKDAEEKFARARQLANGDIDAYAAALLAAERQRVVGIVEAAKNVLLAFHDWPAHDSAFANNERSYALSQLAARLTETEG